MTIVSSMKYNFEKMEWRNENMKNDLYLPSDNNNNYETIITYLFRVRFFALFRQFKFSDHLWVSCDVNRFVHISVATSYFTFVSLAYISYQFTMIEWYFLTDIIWLGSLFWIYSGLVFPLNILHLNRFKDLFLSIFSFVVFFR